MSRRPVIPTFSSLSAIVESLNQPGLTLRRARLWSERGVLPPSYKPSRKKRRGQIGGTEVKWPEGTDLVLLQTFWLSQVFRRWDELQLHLWFLGYEYPVQQVREIWSRVLERRKNQFLVTAGKLVGDLRMESIEDKASAIQGLALERARRMRREKVNLWEEGQLPETLGLLLRRAFTPKDPSAWAPDAEEKIQHTFGPTRSKQSNRPTMAALVHSVRRAQRRLLLEIQVYSRTLLAMGLGERLANSSSALVRRGIAGFTILAASLLFYRERYGSGALERWFHNLLQEIGKQSDLADLAATFIATQFREQLAELRRKQPSQRSEV